MTLSLYKPGPSRTGTCGGTRKRCLCLSTDASSARELFHTFGYNPSQLHHLMAQFCVFRDVALNTIAIGLELFA